MRPEYCVCVHINLLLCVCAAQMMNGRWYGGRQLEVAIWDGVTSYQIEETDLERVDRLSKWEDFISSSSEQTDAAQTET